MKRLGSSPCRKWWVSCCLFLVLFAASCGASSDPPHDTLGMRVGQGLFDLDAFQEVERELGTDIRYTVQFTGRQSTQDMNGSAFGLLAADDAGLPAVSDRIELSITVPLGFGTANARTAEGREEIADNFQNVTAGAYDRAYARVADRLIDAGFGDAIIRLGHEFNGAWAPWSSRSNEQGYIEAYCHVHQLFRSRSEDFRFDWTAMRVGWVEWGVPAYPGDDYVDIMGMDIYWKIQPGDELPWSTDLWERDFLSVMRQHQRFAARHGKPVSYPEWGLTGADAPAFVEAMQEWLASVPDSGDGRLEYHSYFNTGEEYDLDQYPNARAAYVRLFGN